MRTPPTAKRGILSLHLAAAAATTLTAAGIARATPFFMGSDISLETFEQQQGIVFKDNGVAAPADQILYDNGDNMFRLRLFVNPQTTYNSTNVGAIQTTAYDIALAQQIKADDPSAKFELDLHYSDTWADPGHQTVPAAWAGQTLSQLQTSVYNYTLSTLDSFSSAGVSPDIVQIGNETNSGMLWNTGKIQFPKGTPNGTTASWNAYGSLVNSAISAVHAAQGPGPRTQVSLVIGNGNSDGEPQFFYGLLTNPSYGNVPAANIDIMGVDYYPTTTNDLPTITSNLTALATTFNKKIMVMETDAPWESTTVGSDPNFPDTPAGQAGYISALATKIKSLPNNDGMGLLYWYPESVQTPGNFDYNGGATALFDPSGNALQAITGTASTPGSFSITQNQWNTSASGTWENNSNWTTSSPTGSDVEADFLSAISSPQTISTSTSITLGTIRFQNSAPYTISGTGSLTLLSTLGWAYAVVQQGDQQINIPTTIASDAIFSVSTGSSLSFGAPVIVNANQILKPSGGGTINYSSSVTISSGASMTFANSTHATSLSVASTASATITGTGGSTILEVDSLTNNGTINLQTNTLLINYGSTGDPASSVLAMLASGYANGTWTGPGIQSTSAAASQGLYGVGFVDSADGIASPGLAPDQIKISYALYGDLNLDGLVNATDFSLFAANFGNAAIGWDQGDFNFDGFVNATDFGLLGANFGDSSNGPAVALPAADGSALDAFAASNGISLAVPEPATLTTSALILGILMARRRRPL